MPSYCKLSMLGHTGKAATLEGEGDKRRAKFSLAVSEGKDRDGKEIPSSWYYCTAWGKTADRCEGIRSGDLVQVEGRGRMEQFTDKDGNKRTEFKVTAERVVNFSDWQRAKDGKAATVPAAAPVQDSDVPF